MTEVRKLPSCLVGTEYMCANGCADTRALFSGKCATTTPRSPDRTCHREVPPSLSRQDPGLTTHPNTAPSLGAITQYRWYWKQPHDQRGERVT